MIGKRFGIVFLAMALLSPCMRAAAGTTEMSVEVKKAEVRSSSSYLSPVVATLEYGTRVEVLSQSGAWRQVGKPGQGPIGWLNSSALTKKKIVLSAGEARQTGADSSEMSLAGKGFNSDVEKQFKATHGDIDFTWVDRMIKMTVTPAMMQEFLKEGGVTPPKGGAQ